MCLDAAIGHFQGAKLLAMLLHEALKPLQVSFADLLGFYSASLTRFEVFKNGGIRERKLDFVVIKHMKNENFMPQESQFLQRCRQAVRGFEQVGKQQHDTPPMNQSGRAFQQMGQTGAAHPA